MPVWAPSTLPPSTPFLLSPPLAPSLLVVAVGPLDQHRVPGNSVFTPTAAVLLRRSSVADVFFLSLLFLSFSFSLFLPLPHPSSYPVEIKVIKDLPWPPPVGQLNSGETPPDGEASASVPPQHGPQSYEDANGGCRMTAGIRGGCSRCLLGRCQLCATHCRSPSPPSPPFSSSSSPLACLSWAGHRCLSLPLPRLQLHDAFVPAVVKLHQGIFQWQLLSAVLFPPLCLQIPSI